MTAKNDLNHSLILEILEREFREFPYPEFSDLYDQSYPIVDPERIVTSGEGAHEARIVAEEFRTEKPFAEYDLLSLEVALSLFSPVAMAYFVPKILRASISCECEKLADIADKVFTFLSDDCSNRNARIFEEMLALYTPKQRETLGVSLLYIFYKMDDQVEQYDSLWFYKNTLRLLFKSG